MPQKKRDSESAPRTAGELRRLIKEKGYKWTVDPRLRDPDQLPKYARWDARERRRGCGSRGRRASGFLSPARPSLQPLSAGTLDRAKTIAVRQSRWHAGLKTG